MANKYTEEQRAQALARVLAGESVSEVARDTGITRTCIQNWLANVNRPPVTAVEAVMTGTADNPLVSAVSTLLLESVLTLTAHAKHYRSDRWLNGEPKDLLDSTRAVGGRLVSIMDRLPGAAAIPAGRDADG